MKKFMENPEIKRIYTFTALFVVLILAILYIIMKFEYNSIKRNYIDLNAALAGRIVSAHPELKNDIASVIIKGGSSSDISEGRRILAESGYDASLPLDFVNGIRECYQNNMYILLTMVLLFFAAMLIFTSIQYKHVYDKLELIIEAADDIKDKNFKARLGENYEGTCAKLAHAINSTRAVMETTLNELSREKLFLADTLSDISHQLKTPISSLIMYNDILLSRNTDEEKRKEFLQISARQLGRIEVLVKNMLKLARLDAGVIKYERRMTDISDIINEAAETMMQRAEEEKIDLIVNLPEDKVLLNCDPDWIYEAIVNLIKNSIEHTAANGCVEIQAEKTAVCIRITVKDNGEGIPAEDIPNVFKRFYKGKRSKKTDSVGIGLSLSKSIVEGHEGIIKVSSREGEWTRFTITFLNS